MFSIFRNRFGIPGVISVIALVFAMLGGAYAASSGSPGNATASAKKGKQGPPGPRGKTGPAGAVGPPGAAGAKGDTGAQGPEGKQGPPGTNGTNGTKGADGTFSTEPLPSGETLTGVWSVSGAVTPAGLASISFPIQVSPAPTGEVQFEPASTLGLILGTEGITPDFSEFEAHCPGSVTEPKAAAGFLCIYKAKQVGATSLLESTAYQPASAFGVTVPFSLFGEGEHYARGTWAVTA